MFKTDSSCSARSERQGRLLNTLSAPLLLLVLRLMRIWNQTGQKHAGEYDIARNVFPIHGSLLWLLVIAAYMNLAVRLSRRGWPHVSDGISSIVFFAICIAALRFKISFTSADAPELLFGLPKVLTYLIDVSSLVSQGRMVFISIGAAMLLSISAKLCWKSFSRKGDKGRDNFWSSKR